MAQETKRTSGENGYKKNGQEPKQSKQRPNQPDRCSLLRMLRCDGEAERHGPFVVAV